MQQRVATQPADSWLDVTLSLRQQHISRDPAKYCFPGSGVLRFTYALCAVDPLPELDRTRFSLDLHLPWMWWTASALLDLVANGDGRWDDVTLDGIPMRLPPNLPHRGVLSFTFVGTGDVMKAGRDEGATMTLPSLELRLPSHRAVAAELEALPRGEQHGGQLTVRFEGHEGERESHLPLPLPPFGRVSIELSLPVRQPGAKPTLSEAAFDVLLRHTRELCGSPQEQADLLRAGALDSPLTSQQALTILEAVEQGAAFAAPSGRVVASSQAPPRAPPDTDGCRGSATGAAR